MMRKQLSIFLICTTLFSIIHPVHTSATTAIDKERIWSDIEYTIQTLQQQSNDRILSTEDQKMQDVMSNGLRADSSPFPLATKAPVPMFDEYDPEASTLLEAQQHVVFTTSGSVAGKNQVEWMAKTAIQKTQFPFLTNEIQNGKANQIDERTSALSQCQIIGVSQPCTSYSFSKEQLMEIIKPESVYAKKLIQEAIRYEHQHELPMIHEALEAEFMYDTYDLSQQINLSSIGLSATEKKEFATMYQQSSYQNKFKKYPIVFLGVLEERGKTYATYASQEATLLSIPLSNKQLNVIEEAYHQEHQFIPYLQKNDWESMKDQFRLLQQRRLALAIEFAQVKYQIDAKSIQFWASLLTAGLSDITAAKTKADEAIAIGMMLLPVGKLIEKGKTILVYLQKTATGTELGMKEVSSSFPAKQLKATRAEIEKVRADFQKNGMRKVSLKPKSNFEAYLSRLTIDQIKEIVERSNRKMTKHGMVYHIKAGKNPFNLTTEELNHINHYTFKREMKKAPYRVGEDANQRYVYRVLNTEDINNLDNGLDLTAKNPNSKTALYVHVADGSNLRTSYISTGLDPNKLKKYARVFETKNPGKIAHLVRIDLNQLPENTTLFDCSNEKKAKYWFDRINKKGNPDGKAAKAVKNAKSDKEVVLQGIIPKSSIVRITFDGKIISTY